MSVTISALSYFCDQFSRFSQKQFYVHVMEKVVPCYRIPPHACVIVFLPFMALPKTSPLHPVLNHPRSLYLPHDRRPSSVRIEYNT
jgi:hypothetical protein